MLAVRRAVFNSDEHIVPSAVFAHLYSEQVAVHVKRRWFPLWLDGEVYQLRQFHHLTAVEGYLFGMVDYTVTSHPAVLVLLKTDVYAKLCLENINESLYALTVLLAQRFAVVIKHFADVGVQLCLYRLSPLTF